MHSTSEQPNFDLFSVVCLEMEFVWAYPDLVLNYHEQMPFFLIIFKGSFHSSQDETPHYSFGI